MSTLRSSVGITVFVGGLVLAPAMARADVIGISSLRALATGADFGNVIDTDADGIPDRVLYEHFVGDGLTAPNEVGAWSEALEMSELFEGMSTSTATEYSSIVGPLEFTASARSSVLASAGPLHHLASGASAQYFVVFAIDQPYSFSFAANVMATAHDLDFPTFVSFENFTNDDPRRIARVDAPLEGGSSSAALSGLLTPGTYLLESRESARAEAGSPIFVPMPIGFGEAEFDVNLTLTPVSIPEPAAAVMWVVAIGFLVRRFA